MYGLLCAELIACGSLGTIQVAMGDNQNEINFNHIHGTFRQLKLNLYRLCIKLALC